jgi:hypothetical protein
MSRVCAELMPGRSGADYTAEFSGSHNAQALERATEITLYGGTAAGVVEVSVDGVTWVASGTAIAASGLTHMASPTVCRGIRVAGQAAATPAPVRVLVRHGI